MITRLGEFTLDAGRAELRGPRGPVALEPKAYDLLLLLLSREGRVVSRDEAIAEVWGGRFVSDAAVSTVVKSLRRALGDDGASQRLVETVRGRGFRLAAGASAPVAATAAPPPEGPIEAPVDPELQGSRPKLAILPFRRLGSGEALGAVALGLPADLVAGLSRLRWLQVVAGESSFRLGPEELDPAALRASLGATYALGGLIEVEGGRLALSVELSDLRSRAVVWAQRFEGRVDDLHAARLAAAEGVIAALELQIPLHEAMRARALPSERLDAWGAYHLGLSRVFRFTEADNAAAAAHFERATRLDPLFASAFAGLSFTSYQRAAMPWGEDRPRARADARAQAERALELDPLDPFANLSQGRLFVLEGRPEDGRPWLDRSVALSPSYAKGHYSRGFAAMLAGRTEDCLRDMDRAIELSPLDPVLCAMQSCKAVAHLAAGRAEEAADWANRGARAPGAHIAMLMTAVAASQAAGDRAGARAWLAALAARYPGAGLRRFFTVLPFADARLRTMLGETLQAAGVGE